MPGISSWQSLHQKMSSPGRFSGAVLAPVFAFFAWILASVRLYFDAERLQAGGPFERELIAAWERVRSGENPRRD